MKSLHATRVLALGTMLGIAMLSAPLAFADISQSDTGLDPFTTHLQKMTDKNGMVSKKNFLAMMEKRFDMMDKKKTGMISKEQVMVIFSDKP